MSKVLTDAKVLYSRQAAYWMPGGFWSALRKSGQEVGVYTDIYFLVTGQK
jgi:hypothetical protein